MSRLFGKPERLRVGGGTDPRTAPARPAVPPPVSPSAMLPLRREALEEIHEPLETEGTDEIRLSPPPKPPVVATVTPSLAPSESVVGVFDEEEAPPPPKVARVQIQAAPVGVYGRAALPDPSELEDEPPDTAFEEMNAPEAPRPSGPSPLKMGLSALAAELGVPQKPPEERRPLGGLGGLGGGGALPVIPVHIARPEPPPEVRTPEARVEKQVGWMGEKSVEEYGPMSGQAPPAPLPAVPSAQERAQERSQSTRLDPEKLSQMAPERRFQDRLIEKAQADRTAPPKAGLAAPSAAHTIPSGLVPPSFRKKADDSKRRGWLWVVGGVGLVVVGLAAGVGVAVTKSGWKPGVAQEPGAGSGEAPAAGVAEAGAAAELPAPVGEPGEAAAKEAAEKEAAEKEAAAKEAAAKEAAEKEAAEKEAAAKEAAAKEANKPVAPAEKTDARAIRDFPASSASSPSLYGRGVLRVVSDSPGVLYVNGTKVGKLPDVERVRMEAGTYMVRVAPSGRGRPKQMEVRVDADREVQVNFRLR